MKIDPYKHKEKFLSWKEKVEDGIPGICKQNSDTILHYISDKELSEALEQMGLKVSTVKIKKAINILYSDHWKKLDIDGKVIAEVFRYFQNGV